MYKYEKKPQQQSQRVGDHISQQTGGSLQASIQQMSSLMGNQAMLSALGYSGQDRSNETPFSAQLRARFEPTSTRSRPVALDSALLQKAEERYQTPLDGLKAFEDTALTDSGFNGYAQGREIHIDDSLSPSEKERVALHEIGHVVQRGSGMAQGNGFLDNPALENQADQGFVAPLSFAMPASGSGPVMGSRGRPKAPVKKKQRLSCAKNTKKKKYTKNDLRKELAQFRKNTNLSLKTSNLQTLHLHTIFKNFRNANAMVSSDFKNLPVESITAEEIGNGDMDTSYDGEIRFISNFFNRGSVKAKNKNYFGNYSSATTATSRNHYLTHELGHVVNSEIIKKVRDEQDGVDDWKGNKTASAVIADAIMKLKGNSKKAVLNRLNLTKQQKITPKELADHIKIEQNLKQLAPYYSSEYGVTDAGELFAEAFADYYSSNGKQTKPGRTNKSRSTINPLSRSIVNSAKALYQDQKGGKKSAITKFKETHFGQQKRTRRRNHKRK